MKHFYLILILLFVSFDTISKAGPEVPLPKIQFQAAYEIAYEQLLTEKFNVDPNYFFAKDYILGSISYRGFNGEQVWIVSFFHPVANDHSVTFYISQKGKVIKHEATE